MRLTSILRSMHIGNTFKRHWELQHKRKVVNLNDKIKQKLEDDGRKVVDPLEFLNLKRLSPSITFQENIESEQAIDPSLIPEPVKLDSSHPDWHKKHCLVWNDHAYLLTGIEEALHISKTCVAGNTLPERITLLRTDASEELHSRIQEAILNAHTLDALQKKLPVAIRRDRPGWVFPRDYGLPRWRRNAQLLKKIFHAVDIHLMKENVDVTRNQFSSEVTIKTSLTLDDQPFVFELRANELGFGKKPLQPYIEGEARNELLSKDLPSIYPMNRTVSLWKKNIYREECKFPVQKGAPLDHLAMVISKANRPYQNSSPTQVDGRFLLHTFGVAAAYAQDRYGKDVKELPEPLTVNCLHTDSQNFSFGCFQLHSLDLDSSRAANNLFWFEDSKPLFVKCDYVDGKPALQGYNPQVIETLIALYKSQLSV